MAELVSLRAPFPITPLHELEVRTSIRRRMKGSPTDKPAMRSLRKEKGMVALRAFDKAFSDRFFHVVNVDHRIIFSQAEELSAAHACETGSRSLDILHVASARTIPTRVGRTSPRGQSSDRHSDHPHAGGENGASAAFGASTGGPSPRGWGEPSAVARNAPDTRTIPTRVGRTPPAQQVMSPFSTKHRDSKRPFLLVDPLFGNQPKAANLNIAAVRLPPPLDLEALAIGFSGKNEQTHAFRVTFDIVEDPVSCPSVHATDKDIRFGFHEPTFQHTTNGRRGVVGDQHGHGSEGSAQRGGGDGSRRRRSCLVGTEQGSQVFWHPLKDALLLHALLQ